MGRIAIPVFACALALLCGCGGGTPPAEQSAAKTRPAAKVDRTNACSALHPSEIDEIFGVSSPMREVVDEMTCRYHFEQADGKQLKTADGESFIEVKIHWTDGKTVVMAHRLAGSLLGGKDSGFERLTGIGDEAWLAPFASYLAFVTGDVGVEIDLRLLPGERDRAIQLARRLASRL